MLALDKKLPVQVSDQLGRFRGHKSEGTSLGATLGDACGHLPRTCPASAPPPLPPAIQALRSPLKVFPPSPPHPQSTMAGYSQRHSPPHPQVCSVTWSRCRRQQASLLPEDSTSSGSHHPASCDPSLLGDLGGACTQTPVRTGCLPACQQPDGLLSS